MQPVESFNCWLYVDVFRADHSERNNLSDDSYLERTDWLHISSHSLHVALHPGVGPCEISTTHCQCSSCLHNYVVEISFTWNICKTLSHIWNLACLVLFNLSIPLLWCFLSFMCRTGIVERSIQDEQSKLKICG